MSETFQRPDKSFFQTPKSWETLWIRETLSTNIYQNKWT